MIGDLHDRRRSWPRNHHAALALLFWFFAANFGQRRASGNRAVQFVDALHHLLGIKIANQHQHGVVGRVIGFVVAVQILAGHRSQVAFPADHAVAIWMHFERG